MSLQGKVAIVTGGNSGIGKAIVLSLAEQGANIVIDYVANPEATEELEQQVVELGDKAIGVDADVSKVDDLQRLDRLGRQGVRPARHHGEQRWSRDADVSPRHDREAVRVRAERQPQERLLRHAARGQADDRAGRRRPHHQHHVGARGLADAGQHGLLPVEGRHAHADPDGGRRARAARHHGHRRRAGRGRHADQQADRGRPGRAEAARRRDPARAGWPSPKRSAASSPSSPATARATSRRRRSSPTAASCRAAPGSRPPPRDVTKGEGCQAIARLQAGRRTRRVPSFRISPNGGTSRSSPPPREPFGSTW